ncbi:uncharacterized protein LOC120349911 [Nilaparvata lugens]|uniref:uncharacterized protein LOC120349911 n=1 Tax=Nilaparvata lugens TaxID=108931 RepID=UPI00193DE865|nr:uncharacterized protein LOC120349911 [Nilaparvata lugens]
MDIFISKHSRGEKRERESPEAEMQAPKKGCDSRNDELVQIIEATIKKLFEEKFSVLATKDDISGIAALVNGLKQENSQLKQEIQRLKKLNNQFTSRLDDYEDRSRRNNLIFRGLKFKSDMDCRVTVKKFCSDVLGCDRQVQVNRAHTLGPKKDNAPIITHIPSDQDLENILKNVNKLKGTGFSVQKDFSVATRRKRSKLLFLKKELLSISSQLKCFLRGDQLWVEGRSFWQHKRYLPTGDRNFVL